MHRNCYFAVFRFFDLRVFWCSKCPVHSCMKQNKEGRMSCRVLIECGSIETTTTTKYFKQWAVFMLLWLWIDTLVLGPAAVNESFLFCRAKTTGHILFLPARICFLTSNLILISQLDSFSALIPLSSLKQHPVLALNFCWIKVFRVWLICFSFKQIFFPFLQQF